MPLQQIAGKLLLYLGVYPFLAIAGMAFVVVVCKSVPRVRQAIERRNRERTVRRASEVPRPGRRARIVTRNALFLLGIGLVLFSRRFVYPLPDWTLLFGFGIAAVVGAFVWQFASKD